MTLALQPPNSVGCLQLPPDPPHCQQLWALGLCWEGTRVAKNPQLWIFISYTEQQTAKCCS